MEPVLAVNTIYYSWNNEWIVTIQYFVWVLDEMIIVCHCVLRFLCIPHSDSHGFFFQAILFYQWMAIIDWMFWLSAKHSQLRMKISQNMAEMQNFLYLF